MKDTDEFKRINRKLTIMLADNDASDRLLFKDALEELALISNIHTVNNGVQLLEYLHTDGVQLPHLIFMDLNMPRKNGLECLKEIRNDERYKDICKCFPDPKSTGGFGNRAIHTYQRNG